MGSSLRNIGQLIGDNVRYYDSEEMGISRLKEVILPRSVLLVLDNVSLIKTVQTFVCDAPLCHFVLTTRNRSVIPSGAKIIDMELLSSDKSVELLEMVSGKTSPDFSEIAECVGYHPLALQIAGKVIGDIMSAKEWLVRYLGKVSELKIGDDKTNRDGNVRACVELSTEQLKEDKRPLYHSLGIFPENHWIPKDLVLGLWQQSKPEIHKDQLEDLLIELHNLSLIEFDNNDKRINIHDLLHDYNRHALANKSPYYHSHMLNHFNPQRRPWYLPELLYNHKDYLYNHLPYHLMGANREEELWNVLKTAAKKMEMTNDRPDPKLESFLIRIWKHWWGKDVKKAKSYLIKKWFPSNIPPQKGSGYSARTLAVRCAYEVRFVNGLATALCHSDGQVRMAALNYMYSLSHLQGEKDKPEGIEQALDVLETVASRVSWFSLIPNVTALKSIFPALILVVIDQYQESDGNNSTVLRTTHILHDVIFSITHLIIFRILGSYRSRLYIARIIVSKLQDILTEQRETSPNNIYGLKEFFLQPEEKRNLTIQNLRYLNRTCGSHEELEELVQKLLFSSGSLTPDRITTIMVEWILMARGIINPAKVEDIIQEIATRDDGSCLATFVAANLWYVIMDRQPEDLITDKAMLLMKKLVKQWLDSSKENYGIAKHMGRSYQIYPLAYYAAIWTKAKKDLEVDLLNEYANRAEASNDEKLKLHIAGSFGDFRQILHYYPTALKILKPYIQNVQSGTAMWEELRKSLGSLYSIRRAPVEDLMKDPEAPEGQKSIINDLFMEIEAYSYSKPASELYMRSYHVIIDIITYGPVSLVDKAISILESGLKERDLRTALTTIFSGIIAMVLDIDNVEANVTSSDAKA